MKTTWIIAADASRARILQVMDRDARLAEVEDFLNPPAPSEHATDLFVKRVSDYLDKARDDHRYDRLHLVASPKFLGQLRKELGKEVQKLVTDELPKLSWLDARGLEAKLLGRKAG